MIVQGTFTRASTATKLDASTVGVNVPRFETGRSGLAITIEGADAPRAAESLTIPLSGLVSQSAGAIECWAKAGQTSSLQMPFSAWTFFYVGTNTTDARIRLSWRDGGVQKNAYSTQEVTTDEWHHWLVTWDASQMWAYFNGALHCSTGATTFEAIPNSLHIGSLSGASSFWNGLIDNLRTYNRTFNAEQARMRYLGAE